MGLSIIPQQKPPRVQPDRLKPIAEALVPQTISQPAPPQYIFGGDTGMSYDEIQRRRQMANQLRQGQGTPRNVGEGIHAIAKALAARGHEKGLEQRESELQRQADQVFSAAMGAPYSGGVGASYSGDPGDFDFTPYAVGGATRADSFTKLDPQFRGNVARMLKDAEAQGVNLRITSAYRSPELQAQLWENALAKYGDPEVADNWVARPGQSFHNKGMAVDFAAAGGGLLRDPNSPEAQWLKANAGRYGLAVPLSNEPWQVEPMGARGGGYTGSGGGQTGNTQAIIAAMSNPMIQQDPGRMGVLNALLGRAMAEPERVDPIEQRRNQIALEMDELELEALRSGETGATEYGLTPQFGVNDAGDLVMLQLGKDGTAKQVEVPEGVRLQKGVEKLDLGTHYQWYNTVSGEAIGEPISKNLAQAESDKARGKAEGAAEAESAINAPAKIDEATRAIGLIDSIISDPSLPKVTGKIQGRLDPEGMTGLLMSQDSIDLVSKIEQIQGKAFLQAFETLKGGGQITEREGLAAQNAIARLKRVQSDEAYVEALTELKTIAENGIRRARGEDVPEYNPGPAGGPPPPEESEADFLKRMGLE